LAFSLTGFILVHVVFAYLVFWLAGLKVDHSMNSPLKTGTGFAIAIDIFLIALFGCQHTSMARNAFKSFSSSVVAPGLERTVYVWWSVLALFALVHFYQPIPVTLWKIDNTLALIVIWALFVMGWLIAAVAYLSIGIFYLLGVSQAVAWYRNEPQPPPPLVDGYAYRLVRNPQQLGLLIAFWSTPNMTAGHLIFAAGMSIYIVVGMAFEERDLIARHGNSYITYKKGVPAIIPRIFRR
jgi:methanethiol S-methyltransferase